MTMTMPTMTIRTARLLIALCLIGAPVVAFNGLTGSNGAVSPARTATKLAAADNTDNAHHHYDDDDTDDDTQASFATRRAFLNVGGAALAAASLVAPAQAVERAVGGAEIECRKRGDCLQKGELDGAVGWNWGANERCDPSDPRCGSDGVLRDAPPAGDAVPSTPNAKVTHEVTLSIQVGRAESGTLRFGLFGDATPKSVQELVDFLSPGGLATSSKFLFEEGFGMVSAPLSMSKGYGLLTGIVPQKILTFGIPSQSAAYARSIGSSTAGDNFAPQPRPKEQLQNEKPVRLHDAAGLISIASAGVGYASNGPEDETFSKAFDITAGPAPSLDKADRKVIGQVLDQDSMAFLARLSSLPTKKGIKGVIPGANWGPPLLKITVTQVAVKAVGESQSETTVATDGESTA